MAHRQGVQLLWPVQGDGGNVVADAGFDLLTHTETHRCRREHEGSSTDTRRRHTPWTELGIG